MPHQDNNNTAKLVGIILILVWAAVQLGLSFDILAVSKPPFFDLYTAVVFLLVGRMWNIEVDRLLPVDFTHDDEDR